MFVGARELVEAHARCVVGTDEDEDDADLNQSYLVLVRYLPIVANLENQPEPLEALLTNVSDRFYHCLYYIDIHPNTVN